eukprot:750480-Hanusia_phi.AAC.4
MRVHPIVPDLPAPDLIIHQSSSAACPGPTDMMIRLHLIPGPGPAASESGLSVAELDLGGVMPGGIKTRGGLKKHRWSSVRCLKVPVTLRSNADSGAERKSEAADHPWA